MLGAPDWECVLQLQDRHAVQQVFEHPLVGTRKLSIFQFEQDQRQADILAIFKLAVEEFKFLSNVKLYWELTEQNLEELAIKFRLKGEIPISDPVVQNHATGKNQKSSPHSARSQSRRTSRQESVLSLFMPTKLRWNLGVNPNDLTVFGELNLNRYLTLSGEYGDGHQVGVYFRYTF